ncbi:MAG: hypothetical protein JW932_13525 [Deltaproteobacteria bacterium]|nr:hypothetical protein [Deltaproteobacteria bacterium]
MTTIVQLGKSGGDAEITIDVLNPKGVIDKVECLGLSPRIDGLEGKKIAFMHNNKAGSINLYKVLEELIRQRYPLAKIVHGYETGPINPPKDPDMYKKAAAACDAFVFATGD